MSPNAARRLPTLLPLVGTRRLWLPLTVSAALLATVGVGGAAAAPIAATGTLTYTSSTFNSIQSDGENTIIDLSATVSYSGTFSGTSTLHGTLIFHANGRADFRDVETFTGTVNGVPGTVTFNLGGTSDPALVVSGRAVIVDATGGLAGLHGILMESAVVLDKAVGPVGTYSGLIEMTRS
jgi:Protein of unknown function (DUF3224)